jgi:hypothetical protein
MYVQCVLAVDLAPQPTPQQPPPGSVAPLALNGVRESGVHSVEVSGGAFKPPDMGGVVELLPPPIREFGGLLESGSHVENGAVPLLC